MKELVREERDFEALAVKTKTPYLIKTFNEFFKVSESIQMNGHR
jgi:hypothetical protein